MSASVRLVPCEICLHCLQIVLPPARISLTDSDGMVAYFCSVRHVDAYVEPMGLRVDRATMRLVEL